MARRACYSLLLLTSYIWTSFSPHHNKACKYYRFAPRLNILKCDLYIKLAVLNNVTSKCCSMTMSFNVDHTEKTPPPRKGENHVLWRTKTKKKWHLSTAFLLYLSMQGVYRHPPSASTVPTSSVIVDPWNCGHRTILEQIRAISK